MMTQQETDALRDFLGQLTRVPRVSRDPQASNLINDAIAQQPDAGYLLVQRAMLQDQALQTARTQIAQLQAQLQAEIDSNRSNPANAAAQGSGFLDPAGAWGNSAWEAPRNPVAAQGNMAQPQRAAPAPQPQYANPQAPQYAEAPAPTARPGFFGGGGSGFLGNIAATAAGVAGGAFLFQGIENLMGHRGGAGAGNGLMGQNGSNPAPVENTTINNFYDADKTVAGTGSERTSLASNAADDQSASDDYGSNDDLGSDDDISSV